jgi:hypothetical protein
LTELLDEIPKTEDIATVTAEGTLSPLRPAGHVDHPDQRNDHPSKEDCPAVTDRTQNQRVSRHYVREFSKDRISR